MKTNQPYLPSTSRKQVLPATKQKTRTNCILRYWGGLRIQNGEHFVNLCESNMLETKVPSELAGTLFSVESTNNTKIKITHHRVIGD